MENIRDKYGLTKEDKEKMKKVRENQRKSREGMTPEEMKKQSEIIGGQYSSISVNREDGR